MKWLFITYISDIIGLDVSQLSETKCSAINLSTCSSFALLKINIHIQNLYIDFETFQTITYFTGHFCDWVFMLFFSNVHNFEYL